MIITSSTKFLKNYTAASASSSLRSGTLLNVSMKTILKEVKNTANYEAEEDTANKTGYIIAFVIIFVIVLFIIVGRVIYRF
jgi:hypothetical protein